MGQMDIERYNDYMIVSLTSEEVFRVQKGETVGERGGLEIDSKVEIAPLSAIEEDETVGNEYAMDRLQKGLEAKLKAQLFSNADLKVFIPDVALRDARISGKRLLTSQIEGLSSDEEMVKIFPKNGVIINFGGSVNLVDVNAFFNY